MPRDSSGRVARRSTWAPRARRQPCRSRHRQRHLTYGTALGLTGTAALPGGANAPIEVVRVAGGIDAEPRPATTDAAGGATWSFKPIVTSDYRLRTIAPGTGVVEVSAPIRIKVNAKAVRILRGRTAGRSAGRRASWSRRRSARSGPRRARPGADRPVPTDERRLDPPQDDLSPMPTAAGRQRRRSGCPRPVRGGSAARAEPTTTNGVSAWTAGSSTRSGTSALARVTAATSRRRRATSGWAASSAMSAAVFAVVREWLPDRRRPTGTARPSPGRRSGRPRGAA